MRGYYVDFSRTFTAGYGMAGFEATEKQKKHYKLALEIGGSGEVRVDGSTSDEFQKHSNDVPSKHRVAAVWKVHESTSILNSLLQTQNGDGIWSAL